MTDKASIMLRADAALLEWLEAEGAKIGLTRNAFAVMKLKELSAPPPKP